VQAFVEGKILRGDNKWDDRCYTTWSLRVWQGKNLQVSPIFGQVVYKSDDQTAEQFIFQIDGWDREGRYLVASMIDKAGEGSLIGLVFYDSEQNRATEVNIPELFNQMTPADCYPQFEAKGFSRSKVVLIEANGGAEDLAPGQKSRFPTSYWEYEVGSNGIGRAPPGVTGRFWGSVVKP